MEHRVSPEPAEPVGRLELVDLTGESVGADGLDPQVAALAIVAMIERLNYYLLSRQLGIGRDEMLDTTASIIHVGLFGGARRSVGTSRRRAGRD